QSGGVLPLCLMNFAYEYFEMDVGYAGVLNVVRVILEFVVTPAVAADVVIPFVRIGRTFVVEFIGPYRRRLKRPVFVDRFLLRWINLGGWRFTRSASQHCGQEVCKKKPGHSHG